MFTERPVPANLRNLLIENKPFSYAHMIKFERPSRPDASGRVSTSKERYTYLTDASREVVFDDLSLNLANVSNGPQTYIANKVLKVGSVSEQTEARASTFSLVLDGNSIGAIAQANVAASLVNATSWDITWPADVDLVRKGFREGDKVTLTGALGTGDYNIQGFRANNVLRVTKIDTMLTTGAGPVEMTLSSEEIKSILLNKNVPEYASFVNREVFIYRGYFQDGQVVGAPILLFKGIISNVSFDETENNIQVAWGLTSHWGDFAQVKGRITSDDFHRALDQTGTPQPQSALKPSYAYDKGFNHAETSLNLLASYSVQVEKQDVTVKKGFLGIGSKVKVRKYTVSEERNTELDFQLQAKSIPVVYGVRNVPGIPIFADTLVDNSSVVYTVHALSEGEIGGIYDVYVDGNSLICGDKSDFDARSTQTSENTVDLVCRGRADKGDVLGGVTSTGGTPVDYYQDQEYLYYDINYNYTMYSNYVPYVEPTVTVTDNLGKGIVDGESISITSPQSITMDFFSGKTGQKAASSLVEIAQAGKFKIQNSYWMNKDTAEYWGPNHRLIDTAYVVTKYGIKEGETSIPQLEFIIRGKNINAYNYDYSYSHYTKAGGESSDNFNLGDIVTLRDMGGNVLNSNVQIIDKWSFCNPDGSVNARFRFNQVPNLAYFDTAVPSITKFYMQSGSGSIWTMVTWNYEEYRGTVGAELIAEANSVSQDDGYIAINYSGANFSYGDPIQDYAPALSFIGYNDFAYEQEFFNSDRILNAKFNGTLGRYVTNIPVTPVTMSWATQAVNASTQLASRNTVQLAPSASSQNDYYNGYEITIYHYDSLTDQQIVQTKIVKSYNGATRTVVIDDIWDTSATPKTNDVVVIAPPYADKRVSINPAIQTLDYITSKTYGKGLDPIKDLNLWSWADAARVCDTQSNVTVGAYYPTTDVTLGQTFRYPASGPLIWQGTLVSKQPYHLEFSAVIGKLSNAWNSWKSWKSEELVYYQNTLYRVVGAGVKTSAPVHTSGTVDGLEVVQSLQITGSSGQVVQLNVDGNPVRAEKNGNRVSGYSLYDCDEVNYWRYLGWDELSQRYVTRHQTNLSIDTSLPLFDNINSLLEHFGGILRYNGGKYHLDVEQEEGVISSIDTEVRNITSDHIIGKIRLTDEGTRNSYNSLTAAFADPGAKFEAKNISFFNSNYLRADRNVPRKGNLSIPGITNYYNTRILADKYLAKSRFGLTVSFNMAPRGMLLLAGVVIQLQYPKYGWFDKKFRLTSITHQEDCSVDIVAEEYDDSFYILTKLSRQKGTGIGGGTGTITSIGAPTNLRASSIDNEDETYSAIEVTWTNNPNATPDTVYTELYSSISSHFDLVVTRIQGSVLTTSQNHELAVGEQIVSESDLNGLISNKTYFITEVPAENTLILSETKGGPAVSLQDGSDLVISIRAANLIATLPIPINSYLDTVNTVDTEERETNYYWVRHKVLRQ